MSAASPDGSAACICAALLPIDQEFAPCPVHGWTVEPDRHICTEPVWDGPYRMTCGRVLIEGKCARHA